MNIFRKIEYVDLLMNFASSNQSASKKQHFFFFFDKLLSLTYFAKLLVDILKSQDHFITQDRPDADLPELSHADTSLRKS